eukprot:GILJ01008472.1.p1 GENE.GILJ01008472.1~~GILJ01008472.1.p1  ORF type:complete len:114 (+),score=8.89 GILJ01008472.1:61-402(+)
MKVFVHVREKTFLVHCGDGGQKLRWLANVGVARYDKTLGMELGLPRGIRFEDGTRLDMADVVNAKLQEDDHVWVLLRDDVAGEEQPESKPLPKKPAVVSGRMSPNTKRRVLAS